MNIDNLIINRMNTDNFTDAARDYHDGSPGTYHSQTAVGLFRNMDPDQAAFLVPIVVALDEDLNNLRTQIVRKLRLGYCPNMMLILGQQYSMIKVTPSTLLPVLRLLHSRPGQDEIQLWRSWRGES